MELQTVQTGRYELVNGLNIYFEIHGEGSPLVLLHGGGSTIESTFGRILPHLARTNKVIAVELQAHGHTEDRDQPLSFEQDADDVAELLARLDVGKSSILGFSNGGTTALQIAIRHPEIVDKLILASAIFRRDGMQPGAFEGIQQARLEQMPAPLHEAFLKARPDPAGLERMFRRDVERMAGFRDVSEASMQSIRAHALVINGDAEVVRAGHALTLSQTLPKARLAILPGGHGDYIGEICASKHDSDTLAFVVHMIGRFLSSSMSYS